MAVHIWHTAKAVYAMRGFELQTPNYSEITHPEMQDNRTAAEIIEETYNKFKG